VGLFTFDMANETDATGIFFELIVLKAHKIVSDAKQLLCNMTHRGATGADSRDGDGAGVMTGIPHGFFKREAERDLGSTLPEPGEYAVGNVFFKQTRQHHCKASVHLFRHRQGPRPQSPWLA